MVNQLIKFLQLEASFPFIFFGSKHFAACKKCHLDVLNTFLKEHSRNLSYCPTYQIKRHSLFYDDRIALKHLKRRHLLAVTGDQIGNDITSHNYRGLNNKQAFDSSDKLPKVLLSSKYWKTPQTVAFPVATKAFKKCATVWSPSNQIIGYL